MKRMLFPMHAIFHKAIILVNLFILFTMNSFSQSGEKWSVGGNGVSSGDFLGTTNNFPLLFKTNNAQQMLLGTDGVLQLNNLLGTGNRLLQTDTNGKIIPFPMGPSTKVLYGDGTWGALPIIPTALWSTSGSNVYYMGKVGIGTSSPTYPLDVIGDARISNNLYVGGGIVITDKVNANSEVKTGKIQADSIVTDSTKGFYGTTKFNGDIKLSSKLNVDGEATVGGTLKLLGGLTFIGLPPASLDPCVDFLAVGPDGTVAAVDATADLTFDPSSSPCPEPPIVPFTWQTWGNHVNHDLRWIGTIENFDFRIKTNSALRMIVKKDGKVGIGIINPTAKFEIQNDDPAIMTACISKVESATQTRRIIFEPKLNFGDYNALTQANDAGIIWSDGAGGAGTNQDAGFVIAPWPNTTTLPSKGLRMTSLGDIGIGIASPEAKVHIINESMTYGIGLKITSKSFDAETGVISEMDNVLGKTFVGATRTADGTVTENFIVFADGHVRARDIRVYLGTLVHGDFVFEKNYALMPLNELENYFKVYHHLPNVPSTAEVEKNDGINLGEMSEIQLVKIEELTLYIVEMNKKLNELTETISSQQKEIKKLQNK